MEKILPPDSRAVKGPLYRIINVLPALVLLLAGADSVAAIDVYSEDFLWALNLTETWELLEYDQENGIVSFSDMEGHAIFQVLSMDAERMGDDAAGIARTMSQRLGSQGEVAGFEFNGHDAALAEASWNAGGNPVEGYIITIDDKPRTSDARAYPHDYVLILFSLEEEFATYHDWLLSNADGFSPLVEEFHMPGPISQFIRGSGGSPVIPFPESLPMDTPLSLSPDNLQPMSGLPLIPGTQADIEAAYATIEREARILNQFTSAPTQLQQDAWRRYYQMLYKDSWYDMRSAAEIISGRLEAHRIPRSELPSEILAWIQGFAYRRTGSLSDLEPAWVCIQNEAGDCDSLGLAYMALLDHLGFDTLLMISPVHAHSLVGVDVNGPGARFPFLGRQWLVAELTADVPIGMIAADQADPADWLGFDLDFSPEP